MKKTTSFFKLEVLIPVEAIDLVKTLYVNEYQTPAKMVEAELEDTLLHTKLGDIFVTNKGIVRHRRYKEKT